MQFDTDGYVRVRLDSGELKDSQQAFPYIRNGRKVSEYAKRGFVVDTLDMGWGKYFSQHIQSPEGYNRRLPRR